MGSLLSQDRWGQTSANFEAEQGRLRAFYLLLTLGNIVASDSDITRLREPLSQRGTSSVILTRPVPLGSRPTLASLVPFIHYLEFISGEALLN